MVISHKNKYVFIELPRTASTAIAKELCKNYNGEQFISEHATFDQFKKKATDVEKKYFIFTCIRNPMDKTISLYYKFKSGQKRPLSFKKHFFKNPKYFFNNLYFARRYYDIKKNNLNFDDYFLKYYKIPYDDTTSISEKEVDYTIRFEKLQEDFSLVLKKLDIAQIRPIPEYNVTNLKKNQKSNEFFKRRTYERAKFIFGPFMSEFGYQFPREWGDNKISLQSKILYNGFRPIRKFFWHLLK